MKKIIMAAFAALALFGCNKTEIKKAPVKDSVTVTPKESVMDADGGQVKVIVSSTGDWTLKGKADYSAWVTPSATSGVDGDYVTFDVKNNAESENKVAEWEFTCGTAKDVFKLTSKGIVIIPDHLKLASDAKLVLNEKEGEIVVKVETSLGYRTLKNALSEGADWLKYVTALETEGGATLHFSYDALSGLKDRKAEITISGEGVEPVKVEVLQEAKRVLNVEKPFYTAAVAGEDLEVKIETNVEYKVEIAEDAKSWISVKENKEDGVVFTIAALASGKRSGDVTFTQTNAKEGAEALTAKITVSQLEVLIKWAANMKGNRLFPTWAGSAKPGVSESFTLETLVKFDNFDKMAGQIFTIMGIEGKFLLRMGDVGNPLNRLQIATSTGNFNVKFDFQANQWYHVAVTYDNGQLNVYVDGDAKLSETRYLWGLDLSPAWSYEPTGNRCFWVGYSYEYNRDLYGQMTEIRIWKKALTKEEINAENHFYTVDPNSEGLFSYWKFTKGEGDYIEDATPRGNKLFGQTNVRKQGSDNKGDPGIEFVAVSLPEK